MGVGGSATGGESEEGRVQSAQRPDAFAAELHRARAPRQRSDTLAALRGAPAPAGGGSTSFAAVTQKLDSGGSLYFYLSTGQAQD